MKKQQLKKLAVNKITVSNLDQKTISNIRGGAEAGFLSIGEQCSIDNSCGRLSRRGDLRCSDCQGVGIENPQDTTLYYPGDSVNCPVLSPGE